MIHQQPLPPQELPHIIVTSEKRFVTAFAVHSMLFRWAEKVRRKMDFSARIRYGILSAQDDGGRTGERQNPVVKLHKGGIWQLSILLIMHKW